MVLYRLLTREFFYREYTKYHKIVVLGFVDTVDLGGNLSTVPGKDVLSFLPLMSALEDDRSQPTRRSKHDND